MSRPQLALTRFVDVSDREDLFEILDNERVLELSRLGGGGFSGVANLRRSTGIERRRILKPGVAPFDVTVAVAELLRSSCDFRWSECPAVLLCHSHVDPDRASQLAAELAAQLDLPRSRVRGFNLGCSGFLRLIDEGSDIARENPGRHVPLITVEIPEQWHDAADRAFCGIVSAGAAATTIRVGSGHRLLTWNCREVYVPPESRNGGRALFTNELCEGFDFRGCPQTREVMHMDGESVFINGVELMLEAGVRAFQTASASGRVIAVPHQPSGKLLKTLIAAARQDLPGVQLLNNLPDFGNMLSSAIPTALARIDDVALHNAVEAPAEGDTVLLMAAGISMPRRADHMTQGYAALAW